MPLRVIIGQGTAAEVYRYTQPYDGFENLIIGPRGLWAALPANLKMGQPAHLLTLPGQQPQPFKNPSGLSGLNDFLDVNTYQERLLELSKSNDMLQKSMQLNLSAIEIKNCSVQEVRPHSDASKLVVVTKDPKFQLVADQVVIATGIGPQRAIDSEDHRRPCRTTPCPISKCWRASIT